MSGALQAIFQNQRSFTEPPPTVIGQAYGGGYYAGKITTTGSGVPPAADYYLIVAPKASGQANKKIYPTYTSVSNTNYGVEGKINTDNLYATGNSDAANFVKGLSIGGYTDWYIPARYELEAIYYNLKPTTQSNSTSYGGNPFSIPSRSGVNYTAGDPAQTSATIFRDSNSEAFDIVSYWSSTESGSNTTWDIYFGSGVSPNNNSKLNANACRAIRRVAV
jgi:hypothetical protein